MKRNLLVAAGVGISLLFIVGCAKKPAGPASTTTRTEIAPAGHPQTICPVMGSKVDTNSLHVDVDGKRIYVCCQACVTAVKKDPAKYIAKLEAEGVKLEAAPSAGGE